MFSTNQFYPFEWYYTCNIEMRSNWFLTCVYIPFLTDDGWRLSCLQTRQDEVCLISLCMYLFMLVNGLHTCARTLFCLNTGTWINILCCNGLKIFCILFTLHELVNRALYHSVFVGKSGKLTSHTLNSSAPDVHHLHDIVIEDSANVLDMQRLDHSHLAFVRKHRHGGKVSIKNKCMAWQYITSAVAV